MFCGVVLCTALPCLCCAVPYSALCCALHWVVLWTVLYVLCTVLYCTRYSALQTVAVLYSALGCIMFSALCRPLHCALCCTLDCDVLIRIADTAIHGS